ncbi:MAG: hypothetical protein ACLFMQ_01670 [Desulfohalobiaceae bacterium]
MEFFMDKLQNETWQIRRDIYAMMAVVCDLGKPEASDDDKFVASTKMQNDEYTLANTKPDVPRNILVTVTQNTANDTMGELTVTGKDANDNEIEEVIEPNADSTKEGDLAFAEITSIVGSGWSASGTDEEDSIKIGTGNKLGLPIELSDKANILVNIVDNAIQTYTAAVSDPATLAGTTIDAQSGSGSYDGSNAVRVLVKPEI